VRPHHKNYFGKMKFVKKLIIKSCDSRRIEKNSKKLNPFLGSKSVRFRLEKKKGTTIEKNENLSKK